MLSQHSHGWSGRGRALGARAGPLLGRWMLLLVRWRGASDAQSLCGVSLFGVACLLALPVAYGA